MSKVSEKKIQIKATLIDKTPTDFIKQKLIKQK